MSLNVQMVCGPGPACEAYDVDARWPGSERNASIWSQSDVKVKIMNIHPDYHILGDSAYPLETYLMVPYK